MKKLVAMAGGVVAAIGFSVAICSPAQAEPFVPCPYDPAVPGAWQQWHDQKLAEASALDQEYRAKIHTLTGAERLAYAQSVLDRSAKMEAERNAPESCFSLQSVSEAPEFNPEPLPPLPEAPLIVDGVAPPQTSGVDCTQLRSYYEGLGPVVNVGDAVARLNKIPGLSQVQGASLAACGLDAIPNAINNPSQDNQQRVFDGACGAVTQFTNGLVDLCGNTPAG